jgi:hypothetical protein
MQTECAEELERFASRLPKSNHTNPITTAIWWILSDQKPWQEQTKQIQNFIAQNFNQNRSHPYSQWKYNQILLDNFSREEKMMNNMKNAWLAFEFFLVDSLKRSAYKYRGIDITHQKTSPYLDHKRKVDYMTSIEQNNKRWQNIWVQLTTEQSWAKIFPKSYQREMKKKRKIVKSLSDIIYNDTEIQEHENKTVDMTAYMVVNGHINNKINIQRENIFMEAFQKRKKDNFSWWWPIRYLPRQVKQDIGKIWLTYHLSLLDFVKFIEKSRKNPTLLTQPIEDLYTHKKDAYIITKKYIPEQKELTHQVFIDHNNQTESLLFSLSYFLNDQTTS